MKEVEGSKVAKKYKKKQVFLQTCWPVLGCNSRISRGSFAIILVLCPLLPSSNLRPYYLLR